MLPIIALAAAGLLKSELVDREKEKRDRWLAAQTQRFSPWTKLTADPVKEADPASAVIGGAMSGAQYEQDAANSAAQNDLNSAEADYYRRASPWSGIRPR